jgi:hypothetical protein
MSNTRLENATLHDILNLNPLFANVVIRVDLDTQLGSAIDVVRMVTGQKGAASRVDPEIITKCDKLRINGKRCCARSTIDFLHDPLWEVWTRNDAYMCAMVKDTTILALDEMKKVMNVNTTNDGDVGSHTTEFCDDFSMMLMQMGYTKLKKNTLPKLGSFIARNYRRIFKKEPKITRKHCNGAYRPVKAYLIEHDEWIRNSINICIYRWICIWRIR